MQLDERPRRYGFFVIRFVKADSPEAAETEAVRLVGSDPKLQGTVMNDPSDPPQLFVAGVRLATAADGANHAHTPDVAARERGS